MYTHSAIFLHKTSLAEAESTLYGIRIFLMFVTNSDCNENYYCRIRISF